MKEFKRGFSYNIFTVKIFRIILNGKTLLYSGQDYPENFRGNTETRTIASDFIRPSIDSCLTRRENKPTKKHRRHVVSVGGFLQVVNLNKVKKQQCRYQKNYMEAFDIFPCYMMKFLCYSCSQL